MRYIKSIIVGVLLIIILSLSYLFTGGFNIGTIYFIAIMSLSYLLPFIFTHFILKKNSEIKLNSYGKGFTLGALITIVLYLIEGYVKCSTNYFGAGADPLCGVENYFFILLTLPFLILGIIFWIVSKIKKKTRNQ